MINDLVPDLYYRLTFNIILVEWAEGVIYVQDLLGGVRAACSSAAPTGENMNRKDKRISINFPSDIADRYIESANRLNLPVSSFAGLLIAIGYNHLLENPEIIAKVMQE